MESQVRNVGVNVTISNDVESYLYVVLSMWPVLIILCIGMSLAFYGVLMRKTAVTLIILAIIIGTLGWIYT